MSMNQTKKHIKCIIENIFNIFYKIPFFIFEPFVKERTKKYNFSICSVFKNESKFLVEWIEFHKMIGVDHIFLYDNNSDDDYMNYISNYIDEGYITLKIWKKKHAQMQVYEDCYRTNSNSTNWLALLDIDEFICLHEQTNIKSWIKKFSAYPAVHVCWQMFGTNGRLIPSKEKLLIEQYTHGWPKLYGVGKIFLNTNKIFTPIKFYNHYIFNYFNLFLFKLKVPMINEHKKFIFFPELENTPKRNSIQLNHYWSKSYEDYIKKINRGSAHSERNTEIKRKIEFFDFHELKNTKENKIIWRFLIKLKLQMNKIQ
jgi:hypothetical protein